MMKHRRLGNAQVKDKTKTIKTPDGKTWGECVPKVTRSCSSEATKAAWECIGDESVVTAAHGTCICSKLEELTNSGKTVGNLVFSFPDQAGPRQPSFCVRFIAPACTI